MIQINVSTGAAHQQRADALLLAFHNSKKLTASGAAVKEQTGKALPSFFRQCADLDTFGNIHTLYDVAGCAASRLMLIDAGDAKKLSLQSLRALAAKSAKHLNKQGVASVAVCLAELNIRGASVADKVQAIAEGFALGMYRFNKYQTKPAAEQTLSTVHVLVEKADVAVATDAVARGLAIASGTNFARDLANEPGNVCTPSFLGEQALGLKHPKLDVTVMDQKAIEEAGFTALLAVNQGSDKEARFIVLRYHAGNVSDAPTALVGKGLTFDAGGICLKPAAAMDEMKFDMCGAAAVLGIFKAITEMNLPLNVLGVIPSTENLLGGSAYKPGDIVTTYQGKTIEVLNTDAEGRIILSDALTYAAEQKPCEMIDFATLTGACVIALGSQATGLLGTSERLKAALKKSGDYTHDRVWELPLYDEYQEQIKSEIADLKNVGGREAGTITAACFLSHFVGETPWAHLDIAGTAWNMKGTDLSPIGATGAGVRVVTDYLLRKATAK